MIMEEGTEIENLDPRDEIARLEAHIEELAAEIENCRKFILAARVCVVLGGIVLVVWIAGAAGLDPVALTAAIVAVLGGFVVLGSNRSTSNEATAELQIAEARRAELIDQIDLRVVGERGNP